jgi:hypothetical protein
MKTVRKSCFAMFVALCLLLQVMLACVPSAASADFATDNLLTNPGFENASGGLADNWQAIGDSWGNGIQSVQEAAYTGSYGISIQTATSNNPWVSQIVPVEEDATYKFDSWFKTMSVSGNVGYKIEFYKGPEKTAEGLVRQFTYYAPAETLDGQWHQISYERLAPPGAKYVAFYLRLYGTGTVYFDDASLMKTKDKPQIVVNTNQVYYYPDLTEGKIDVQLAPEDGIFTGKTVDFAILDPSGHAIFIQTGTSAAAALTASFDPQTMEVQLPYQVSVALKDAAGQELDRQERTIYRWDRPTTLPQNGPVLVDGQPFFPVIAYHAYISDYPYLKDIGINTVQGNSLKNLEEIQAMLNAAQANGLKVLVQMYSGMKVKENFDLTRSIVTRFKDHPAVLGYMIMDEPVANDIAQQDLLDAYKLIRSIDPNHPTYMVEAFDFAYRSVGQATDILVTDVYPFNRNMPITSVGDGMRSAISAVDNVKPVWSVLQTFRLPSSGWHYLPTIGEVRNMAYQALLAGSKGMAYYSINDPGWSLKNSELWPGLVQFKDELALMGGLVTKGSKIHESVSGLVQWGVWQEGSEQYAVAINTTGEEQDVVIPLDQTGNKVELLYGAETAQFIKWDAELTAHLEPWQTLVYHMTPILNGWQVAQNLIQDGHWQAQAGHLLEKLQKLVGNLSATQPITKQAVDMATNFLRELSHLEAWVDSQSDDVLEGKREQLLASIEQVRQLVQQIVPFLVQLNVQATTLQVAPGDVWEMTIQVCNTSDKKVDNVRISVSLPDAWNTPNIYKDVGILSSGQSFTFTESFTMPDAIPTGSYPVTAKAEYKYKAMLLVAEYTEIVEVAPLITAKLTPNQMDLHKAGMYPFTIELSNNAVRALNVELEASDTESGLSFDLAPSVDLALRETKTVQGYVTIPSSVIQAVFSAQVAVRVGGALYSTLPLNISVDPNLIYNPGFEKQTLGANHPVGWSMRASIWDKGTAHSGQASARLDPDANNTFNVINTDTPKAVPVIPGHRYVLTGWVKNSSTAGSVALGVREANAGGVIIKYTWTETQLNSDWTKVTVDFTASADTSTAWVYFKMDQNTNGPAWVDDLELLEADPSLIYNPGFEEQASGANRPDGWNMRAGVWDKGMAYNGQASARLDPDTNNVDNVINTETTKAVPVIPGHRYLLTGWVKNNSTTGSVLLGVREADANRVTVTYTWTETQLNSDWTKVTVAFTARPNTSTAWVYFKMNQQANGSAWLDDLELMEQD